MEPRFKTRPSNIRDNGLVVSMDGVDFWCPTEFYNLAMSAVTGGATSVPSATEVVVPVALDEELAKALMLLNTLDQDDWEWAEDAWEQVIAVAKNRARK